MKKKKNFKKTIIDRLLYNGKEDNWTIEYHEQGKSKETKYYVDKEQFKLIKDEIENAKNEFEIFNNINISRYMTLIKFDIDNKTDYANDYLKNNITYSTKYNLRNLFKNERLSFKEKLGILKKANKDKKRTNTTVDNPKSFLIKGAIASLAIITTLSTGVFSPKNKKNNTKNNITLEQNTNDIYSSDTIETTIIKNDSNLLINNSNNKESSKIEIKNNIDKKEDTNINTEKESTLNDYTEIKTLKVNNYFNLKNTNLYYSTTNTTRFADTNYLNVDNYKISYICIMNDNQILDIQNANNLNDIYMKDLITSYQENYGPNIDIYVNFNGYDNQNNIIYAKIGWTNIKDINTKENNKELTAIKKQLSNKQIEKNYTLSKKMNRIT